MENKVDAQNLFHLLKTNLVPKVGGEVSSDKSFERKCYNKKRLFLSLDLFIQESFFQRITNHL